MKLLKTEKVEGCGMKARALNQEEIQQVRWRLASSEDPFSVRDAALFEIGLNCGLRISEALALTVGQVLQHGRVVERLELTVTKGDKPRAVPLNRRARETLQAMICWKQERGESLDPGWPLFYSPRGGSLSRALAHNRLKGLYARCGLGGKVTTMSMRKTFGTLLHDRGVHIREIQVLLGHASLATTQRYIEVTDANLTSAVAVLDG